MAFGASTITEAESGNMKEGSFWFGGEETVCGSRARNTFFPSPSSNTTTIAGKTREEDSEKREEVDDGHSE